MSDLSSQWALASGPHPMLAGRIQTHQCEPHLHETFTIAYMRRGVAQVRMVGQQCLWRQGEIFLGNPYEVHAGGNPDSAIEYDVYYPKIELLSDSMGVRCSADWQPRFVNPILRDPDRVRELLEALSGVLASGTTTQSIEAELDAGDLGESRDCASVQTGLRHFFRRNRELVYTACTRDLAPILHACRILQESIDSCVRWDELPRQVGFSRPHFIRQFHKMVGLPPSAYFRQLRLAKALRLLCGGMSIADAAAESGFTDQAHLTREFKRAFGRTPGKIAHAVVSVPRLSA